MAFTSMVAPVKGARSALLLWEPAAGTAGQARWVAPGSPVSPRPCRLSWPFQNPGHGDLSCWSQRSVHADVLFGVETSAFCF